jgi:hypothetical protein
MGKMAAYRVGSGIGFRRLDKWMTVMRAIKYVMFAWLLLAAYEASALEILPSNAARFGLAAAFLAYGVWALLLFRRPSRKSSVAQSSGPQTTSNVPQARSSVVHISLRTALLLLFRIAFIFCAFAYLGSVLYKYDTSAITPGSRHDFMSFLLAAFDQTFPPLTAICQYVFPDLKAVVWNLGNKATLALRLAAYVLFVVIVASVVKEVWLLGYRSQFAEMEKRVEIGGRRRARATSALV